eukprot:scaffold55499_cov69-Phaeocystis_antarctica.AAC.1
MRKCKDGTRQFCFYTLHFLSKSRTGDYLQRFRKNPPGRGGTPRRRAGAGPGDAPWVLAFHQPPVVL